MRMRIIPADAGSTILGLGLLIAGADHPRGCGEHVSMLSYRLFHLGSSPRMRGAPSSNDYMSTTDWIIPADAGSTVMITP